MADSIGKLKSQLGAHAKWARTADWSAATDAARRAFVEGFFEKTDPSLPEEIRIKQAESLRKAHYTRMALRSAMVRRAKRDAKSLGKVDGGPEGLPTQTDAPAA